MDLDSDSDGQMDVDQAGRLQAQPTKQIFKRKIRNRQYYKELKKQLRRSIKDGRLPNVGKVDDAIEKLK